MTKDKYMDAMPDKAREKTHAQVKRVHKEDLEATKKKSQEDKFYKRHKIMRGRAKKSPKWKLMRFGPYKIAWVSLW